MGLGMCRLLMPPRRVGEASEGAVDAVMRNTSYEDMKRPVSAEQGHPMGF